MDVTITHTVRGSGGRYTANVADSDHRGYLDWEADGENVRIATHTLVPPPIGGKGIAAMLVEHLVADARRKGFKVEARCSYVAKKFDENPEWSDLRAG
ncbi:GNAT family N-acetyltransferase [Erythrobacter sp. HKB08]|uniref:GNAT family N-acetyltransferase n=1 Tax=Erythrobacter sp. HKB08 TaxID=2502843 RepID=UPI003513692F